MEEEKRTGADAPIADDGDDGYVALSDILGAALEFSADPSNEGKFDAVQSLINKVYVRERLTLMDKYVALVDIMAAVPESASTDVAAATIALEVARYFRGLLRYAMNLKVDIDYSMLDVSVYDVLEAFGFGAYMRRFCAADYDVLCGLVRDAVNFSGIDRIVGTASLLNEDNLKEFKEVVQSLRTELTPERLERMKAIAAAAEPAWQALKETVADEAVGNALLRDVGATKPADGGEGGGE